MSARMVPYLCPYCGDEDLVPYDDPTEEHKSAWRCYSCTRVFTVKYHGMVNPSLGAESLPEAPQPQI